MSRVPSRNANKHTIKRRTQRKIKAGLLVPAKEIPMGEFVRAQKTRETRRFNGQDEEITVYIFGNKPTVYHSIEDAAAENEKVVKKNILSTWCVFELKAETKTEDYPIKTYLVESEEDFASSAEP